VIGVIVLIGYSSIKGTYNTMVQQDEGIGAAGPRWKTNTSVELTSYKPGKYR
jgi:hypothetical protein